VEKLARFGLVAQGISFGLVAVLAIQLVIGEGGKATDREGALRALAANGLGRIVVFVLATGFGSYALWRLAQVFLGHDLEEHDGRKKWGKRLSSLGKAAIYGVLAWGAFSIALGEHDGGGNKEQQATGDILGWPGGRWIVGAIAIAIAGAALWNFYRAVSGSYKDSLKTGEMSASELNWTTRIAFVGLMSRAVVFALISWFFFKAAAEYDARKAQGLDGALRKLAHAPYGPELLGIVAAGLFAFGVFCLIQARYREV
jgi:Domain of Unknown Function (DUF1206)